MNLMKYKDYIAEIQIDQQAGILAGTVLNMKDVITFEGRTVKEVIQAFHNEVDTYLTECEESGEVPDRPFSGKIAFRTIPKRHHNIFIAARLADAKSINAWMDETLAEAAENVIRQHTQVGDDIAQEVTPIHSTASLKRHPKRLGESPRGSRESDRGERTVVLTDEVHVVERVTVQADE